MIGFSAATTKTAIAGALPALAASAAAQQAYPCKPIRLITAFASGGSTSIIDKASAEVAKILAQPDFQEKLIGQGLEPTISTSQQYAALLKEGLATNLRIIQNANIKFEN